MPLRVGVVCFPFIELNPNSHGTFARGHPTPNKYPSARKWPRFHSLIAYYLRRAVLNRTCGTHKKTICFAIFTNNIWSYLLWSPVIVVFGLGLKITRGKLPWVLGSLCMRISTCSILSRKFWILGCNDYDYFPCHPTMCRQHDLQHWSLITLPERKENLGHTRKPMHQVYSTSLLWQL